MVALVLVTGLAGTLGGCGEDGITLPSERPTISLPTGGGTESPTAGPTDAPTDAPTDTGAATESPTETPTPTPAPTETVTATATAEPTEEPAPSESPSGEAAAPADDEEGGLSPWWLVVIGLVLLVGILWWVAARSAKRRKDRAQLLADLEARGQWAVDHGVGALIGAADPSATQQAWSRLNAALVDMAGEVRTLAHRTPADQGAAVIGLRDAVASLQGAAETHARARLGGDPSPATAEAVFAARDRLSHALSAFHAPAD